MHFAHDLLTTLACSLSPLSIFSISLCTNAASSKRKSTSGIVHSPIASSHRVLYTQKNENTYYQLNANFFYSIYFYMLLLFFYSPNGVVSMNHRTAHHTTSIPKKMVLIQLREGKYIHTTPIAHSGMKSGNKIMNRMNMSRGF